MGMMLETTSRRLFEDPHGAHYGSPDKDPAVRLRVLEDAGRSNVPFTTGILIGIGETLTERAESIFAIRRVARAYHGIQEVIVQNFRAKPDTAMARMPDAEIADLAATVAVARLVLGPGVRLQAPPNLIGAEYALLLGAGIDDWGGVSPLTPDHVNPERPWPQIDELAARSAEAGFELVERLTVYPSYVLAGEPWLDPRVLPHVDGARRSGHRAGPGRRGRAGPSVAGARGELAVGGLVRAGRPAHLDRHRPDARPTGARTSTTSTATGIRSAREAGAHQRAGALRPRCRRGPARRRADPAGLSDAHALTLLHADGAELDAIAALADGLRRDAVGDEVTYVVNRNINFTNVCYTGCRFCAFAQRRTDADAYTLSLDEVGQRAEEAWSARRDRGVHAGRHPPRPARHGLLRDRGAR